MSIFGRAEAGTKGTLQLVQRGTDKRIPVELVKQPSGEVLDPTELEGLHVMVSSKSGSWCATIPYTIEDNKLVVEVTADISRQLGLGIYTMTATGRIPDPAYDDGYHDYEVVVDLCKVTKYGSNETPVKVDAKVIEGLRGLNNYQLAVKHGYQGTEEQFAKDIIPKSNYERAKELEGFVGTELEYLKRLKGEKGDQGIQGIQGIQGEKGEQGIQGEKGDQGIQGIQGVKGDKGEQGIQGIQGIQGVKGEKGEQGIQGIRGVQGEKGDTGKSAYVSYLETTNDRIKMTEKQWANANDFFYQFIFRLLKGAGVKPTETDMTADQVYELDRQRREIIEALRHHGVDINEGDGLSTVATKLAEIHAPVIVIHKEQQMLDWIIEESPTIKIYDGYSPASLRYTFGRCSKLRRIPDIIGASAVTDVSYICASCASMVSATLPDLPLVTTAGSAFAGCSSLTSLTIGDVPKCRTFSSLATGCAALQTLEIGNASSAEDISLIAVNCGSLTTVKVSFGNQVNNAQMAFFSCSALQRIDGELDLSTATNVSSTFGGCSSLEEVRIKGIKVDLDLSACANLSVESVKYLVDNLQQVTGKSITLHRDWQTAHPTEARAYAQKATAKGFALTFR
jgi:hypothetical protein epulo_10952